LGGELTKPSYHVFPETELKKPLSQELQDWDLSEPRMPASPFSLNYMQGIARPKWEEGLKPDDLDEKILHRPIDRQ
jgi:hypothetical protein